LTIDGPSIGSRIRERRKQLEVTLETVAQATGLSKPYLSQIETGHAKNPSLETLRSIAAALEMPLEDLVSEPRRELAESGPLPEGLAEFVAQREAQGDPVDPEDVEDLRSIRFRGKQARTPADWAFLYETIVRTIR
jgi:transcriptional regulator with XRE-family HTH domain